MQLKTHSWDRTVGALVGLAVGDALGATIEGSKRDVVPPVSDIVGGGPFKLRPGEWTDDTALALCVADSVLFCGGLDQDDLLRRFRRWLRYGDSSCTGSCVGAGNTTTEAIRRFEKTQNLISDLTGPEFATNGSLMRLAPIAMYWHREREDAIKAARDQSVTTHSNPAAVEACAYFTDVLLDAIEAQPKEHVMRPRQWLANEDIDAVARGSWIGKQRADIQSSGDVIHTLEAALWSVSQTDNFRDAVVLAANLGDDADTVAAVTGQLAGAVWGVSDIPKAWVNRLSWQQRIRGLGAALFHARNPAMNEDQRRALVR